MGCDFHACGILTKVLERRNVRHARDAVQRCRQALSKLIWEGECRPGAQQNDNALTRAREGRRTELHGREGQNCEAHTEN